MVAQVSIRCFLLEKKTLAMFHKAQYKDRKDKFAESRHTAFGINGDNTF